MVLNSNYMACKHYNLLRYTVSAYLHYCPALLRLIVNLVHQQPLPKHLDQFCYSYVYRYMSVCSLERITRSAWLVALVGAVDVNVQLGFRLLVSGII